MAKQLVLNKKIIEKKILIIYTGTRGASDIKGSFAILNWNILLISFQILARLFIRVGYSFRCLLFGFNLKKAEVSLVLITNINIQADIFKDRVSNIIISGGNQADKNLSDQSQFSSPYAWLLRGLKSLLRSPYLP